MGLEDGPLDHIGIDHRGKELTRAKAPGPDHYYMLTATGRGTYESYEIDETEYMSRKASYYYNQYNIFVGGGTHVPGAAYNQQYYENNNRNSSLATQNSGYNSKLVGEDGSHVYAASVIALKLAAVDGPIPIGDAAGAVVLAGAIAYDATQRTFVTYTMRNASGKVYAGRTSGYGDPNRIMMNRYKSHHMRAMGYSNPILDRAVQGYLGYPAIIGREQQLIDSYGGVGDPKVGNSIRGVGYYTDISQTMHNLSNLYFGPLAPYTGFWKRD